LQKKAAATTKGNKNNATDKDNAGANVKVAFLRIEFIASSLLFFQFVEKQRKETRLMSHMRCILLQNPTAKTWDDL